MIEVRLDGESSERPEPAGPGRTRPDLVHPRLTRQFVAQAVEAGRAAFEREMARERARREGVLRRYWKRREVAS